VLGGAWRFLVGGVICLLNCVSENRFFEVLFLRSVTTFRSVVPMYNSPCNLEGNDRDRNLLLPLFRLLANCCLVIFSKKIFFFYVSIFFLFGKNFCYVKKKIFLGIMGILQSGVAN